MDQCSYFGYKEGNCNLMTDSLNESQCSDEECSDPGMKIYKLKIDVPTTTSTTTEQPTTVTEEGTTTTTEEPISTTTTTQSTTTTEEPVFTTTTTQSTTTEKVTTVTEPEINITEPATKELPTRTTPTPRSWTTVTATIPTETTITKERISTSTFWPTAETTTFIDGTTTTMGPKKPFSCDPPDGAEAGLECPTSNFLLNGLGSKSPFFGDALSPKCYDFKEKLYDDTKEEVYYFFSADGGFSITAQCEKEDNLIIKYNLCVMDAHIPAITIHCSPIADMDRVDKVFNASSEEWKDGLVNCNDKTGLQKIYMFDSGDAVITRVMFQCVLFNVADNEVAEVVGDNPVG